MYEQSLVKISSIRFHENSFRSSRFDSETSGVISVAWLQCGHAPNARCTTSACSISSVVQEVTLMKFNVNRMFSKQLGTWPTPFLFFFPSPNSWQMFPDDHDFFWHETWPLTVGFVCYYTEVRVSDVVTINYWCTSKNYAIDRSPPPPHISVIRLFSICWSSVERNATALPCFWVSLLDIRRVNSAHLIMIMILRYSYYRFVRIR